MEPATSAPSIAVLIKHTRRWPEALQVIRLLQVSGAAVTLFILSNRREDGASQMDNILSSIKMLNIDGVADQPVCGMVCLPLEAMAKGLSQYELVIPI
jgi:hypothetical protein